MPAWPGSHYTGMHIREITSSIQKSRDCHEQSLLIERFIAALRWCALLGNCQAATLSGIAGQRAYTIPTILRVRKARPCFENVGHKCTSHASLITRTAGSPNLAEKACEISRLPWHFPKIRPRGP